MFAGIVELNKGSKIIICKADIMLNSYYKPTAKRILPPKISIVVS